MNFAVIGTNFISDRFANATKEVEGANILAVLSRAYDTGAEFAKRHGIEKVYTDLDEMLGDEKIDAVYVASPTFCHSEQSIAAMLAGKRVLCEKMISHDLPSFLEMKATSEKTGAVLVEAMLTDFSPALPIIKNALFRLGKIRRASFEFCQYSSRYDKFLSGTVLNAFEPKLKNSALADIGIYPLHLSVALFGEPKSLTAKSVFLHNGFEGAGSILLEYPEMVATVTYSKISESVNPTVIEGELGSLTIDKISVPAKVILKLRGEPEEVIYTADGKSAMSYEVSRFMEICENESHGELLALSEAVMRCVDKTYKSAGIKFPKA